MIPLRDHLRRLTTPFLTVLIILVNLLVWFYQLSLGPQTGERFLFLLGMIPGRLQLALESPEAPLAAALVPLFTSMFLHGGWLHFLGNMWYLWVFGDNVEDRLGHARFLFFYIACGLGAGLIHTLFNWNSTVPAVGASGAISGVLGAYFVFYPHVRVTTLIPLLFFFFTVQLPAVVLLGFWFLMQFLNGIGSLGRGLSGGVAWWAHIGGFVLGMILGKILQQRRPRMVVS
jgi:membrane associated rhomboid family serine protease